MNYNLNSIKTKLFLLIHTLILNSAVLSYCLSPNEVLVVYNGDNTDSIKIAKQYQLLRKIPAKNMCYVMCSSSNAVSRDEYDEKIKGKIEKYITDNNLKGKILCLALIYGIPLIITNNEIGKIQNINNELAKDIAYKSKFINFEDKINSLKKEIENNNKKIEELKNQDSDASVDSELTMIFQNYTTAKWRQNPYFYPAHKQAVPFSKHFVMYLVSRIDAPTPELALKMVVNSIYTEDNGLQGKAYFDTRGFVNEKTPPETIKGAYAQMDALLLYAAKLTKSVGFDTVVEKTPALFKKGECPDTAIYMGWYSLQNYIDSFTFAPGAIAIHIASGECEYLRGGTMKIWCPNLISNGATATTGPVSEPYLFSFPHPVIFLTWLFGGYSLPEAFFASTPVLSWKMVLLGDPLYTPFKKPLLK